jgi:hypothetical protein
MASASDPEKGLVSAATRPIAPSSTSSGPYNALNSETKPVKSSLELYQLLVGIHTPECLTQQESVTTGSNAPTSSRKRRSDNVGLYDRAKEQERASRLAFLSTSIISNTLYMLQILLAATFTALSAYKDSNRVTLTVLGAMNTVVAG